MFASGKAASASAANYIEDVFSTYLYTGTGATQTITNGIDLAGKGGLVWGKIRAGATYGHMLHDTVRGVSSGFLQSNTTAGAYGTTYGVTSFNSNGYTLSGVSELNQSSSQTYASWTFRKQPKFFDVVTYTGNGGVQNIAHNLGSVPGCIIVKSTSQVSNWAVYHTSLGNTQFLALNQTNAATTLNYWNDTSPTSTQFTVNGYQAVGSAGQTYVAYIFAHNAGGFGLTGTDNVISCGSFTTGSGGKISAPVNLGYEAQWLLAKNVDSAENWVMYDIMRGMNNTGYAALNPNTSGAEYTGTSAISPTATGFDTPNASGPFASSANYIYIAIRRGPMKVPTSGTSVFGATARTGNGTSTFVSSGFATDMAMSATRPKTPVGRSFDVIDKLRGNTAYLATNLTGAEGTTSDTLTAFLNTGITVGADSATLGTYNYNTETLITYQFGRAPSYFDEVCYTGTGSTRTITHNLGVAPELVIIKSRSAATGWAVTCYPALTSPATDMFLQTTAGANTFNWITSPTSTTLTIGPSNQSSVNTNTATYVAYLFATCAGVSKVGSYTGTGTTQQINCGFTGGARFILIKRTDSTGDWYLWDSARGIVAGNDPYLLLNSTAAEVTNTDYVDTYSAGFEISSTAPAAINASGGTFIFLAIA